MVKKINIFKIIIFTVAALLMCCFSFIVKVKFETNLLETFLSGKIENSETIVKVGNKSASVIKIVFESEDEKKLEKLKNDFIKNVDMNYFQIENRDVSKLLKKYLSAPQNFLSDKTYTLLVKGKYDEVYNQSIEALYNPMSLYLSSFEKDPFLLFDDFIGSLKSISEPVYSYNGKYYEYTTLRLISKDGLSPKFANKKIQKLVNIQKKLSDNNSKIYLAGTPVHSFYTSKNSVWSINLICLLSILLIACLTYFYFRSVKILFPILLGIIFGGLCGYCATRLWFKDFQIITMVFSTMLIGIGIDYSYHYLFNVNRDNNFIKNLSISFFTTIVPFVILYFTGIELLRQISVFSVFGLFGIYLFVVFIYPCFTFPSAIKTLKFNYNIYKNFLLIVIIFSLAGCFRMSFNDSVSALYTPPKKLLYAEKLYNMVSGQNSQPIQIITVKGDSLAEILEKEEMIIKNLSENNIPYFSLSKFIPSIKRQKENFNLVQNLYDKNLDKYSDILTSRQIKNLKTQTFMPINFDLNDNLFLEEFMLDKNASMIFVYSDKDLNIKADVVNIIKDVKKYMKNYRDVILKIAPIILVLIYIFLSLFYGFKKAIKLIIPSYLACFCAACLTSLIFGELNLFSLIALFLVLGFTIDYSVFRQSRQEHTEDAIFISCITTAFSFLLLALTGFKLISSITLVLFIGIMVSYLCGYLIYNAEKKN